MTETMNTERTQNPAQPSPKVSSAGRTKITRVWSRRPGRGHGLRGAGRGGGAWLFVLLNFDAASAQDHVA